MASYREIATLKIGRPLRDDEVVHHINGRHGDNDPENLVVITKAAHVKIHADMRRTSAKARRPRNMVAVLPDYLWNEVVLAVRHPPPEVSR